jgi:Nif-specific regulatory protein
MGRSEQELDILKEISQILGDGLELRQVFQRAMGVLSAGLNIIRASLLLWDDATEQLRIVAAIGLTREEMHRGRYSQGEGITGRAMATGTPQVIPDVSQEPDFLNRTGCRRLGGGDPQQADDAAAAANHQAVTGPISFICVPVKEGDRYVGAVSVDKPYIDESTLEADRRLLEIIAGSFAQTIRLHHLARVEKNRLVAENQQLRDNLHSKYRFDNIIGSSPAMMDVLAMIGQVASSRATCLLMGETGCGKELIAKAIHYNSPRRDKPLIRLNCGALSAALLESELFGHMKGAFTGALRDKVGRFEAADGGTIFLDEIGTLEGQLQVKLLRVLQEREFERVGDHRTIQIDVRVIAASNLDLEHEAAKGNFREDLYYRLNVMTFHLPPLRSRRQDIPQLIDYFLEKYNAENDRNLRKMSRELLNTLLRYPWPGNVRELENTVERAVVLSNGELFTEDLLPLQMRLFAQQVRGDHTDDSLEALASRLAAHAVRDREQGGGGDEPVYDRVIREVERQLIHEGLSVNGGVKTRTAEYLGINRNTLNKKVRELAIDSV